MINLEKNSIIFIIIDNEIKPIKLDDHVNNCLKVIKTKNGEEKEVKAIKDGNSYYSIYVYDEHEECFCVSKKYVHETELENKIFEMSCDVISQGENIYFDSEERAKEFLQDKIKLETIQSLFFPEINFEKVEEVKFEDFLKNKNNYVQVVEEHLGQDELDNDEYDGPYKIIYDVDDPLLNEEDIYDELFKTTGYCKWHDGSKGLYFCHTLFYACWLSINNDEDFIVFHQNKFYKNKF